MKRYTLIILAHFAGLLYCRASIDTSYTEKETAVPVKGDTLYGTLLMPVPVAIGSVTKPDLVLFISGSGPTDRDGNSFSGAAGMYNNCIKMLAESMAKQGIASFRYDKRTIRPLRDYYKKKIPFNQEALLEQEKNLRFTDLVDDACQVISQLRASGSFGRVVIAGHSEGSLIGILAAQKQKVQGFASLAGAGFPADSLLLYQLEGKITRDVLNESREILLQIKTGQPVDTILSPVNRSLFRENVRPYMQSWFVYDPAKEIAKLAMPVLVVNGTADLQVRENNAEALHAANPGSVLLIIKDMNHVLKITPSHFENQISYNHPTLPVSAELTDAMVAFVKHLP